MSFRNFEMERWQSTYEHDVLYNLSESGVEPLTVGELLEMGGLEADTLLATQLEYNPSDGSRELREHIAALYPGAAADNVLVTNGGAEANFVISWQFFSEADEVVFAAPNYMQVPGLAANFGARTRPWWLREENGWQPDPAELDGLITPATKLIVVTNPNNPTGAILPESIMDDLVTAADRVGAWILADEIYRGAELDGSETPTFWGKYDRLMVTSGLSKAYGLPGLRLGWALVPADLVERLWARKDYTSIAMGSVSDMLARIALQEDVRAELQTRTREILNRNWPLIESWLAARSDVFRWIPPRAGAIVYARYDLPVDSLELAERLRTEVDCLIVPGAHFDMPEYLRVGFGSKPDRLAAALDRCATVVDALRSAA